MKYLFIGMFRILAVVALLYTPGIFLSLLFTGSIDDAPKPDHGVAILIGLLFWVWIIGAWLLGGGRIHIEKGGKGNERD